MKDKSKNKKKLNFMKTVLMIGYIPLLTANIILTLYASHKLETNLEESTFLRLKSCATSVEQYFTWDIREDILCKDDVSYEFIDSLKNDDIELTFFVEDTRYITSIKDESGNRIEDTKADSHIWEEVQKGNDYKASNVEIAGVDYYVYYMPVKSEAGDVIGMSFAGEKVTTVANAARTLSRSMYFIDTILLIIFGAILFYVAGLIRKPIKQTAECIDTIAHGDITQPIEIHTALEETFMLVTAAKLLQEKLGEIITNVSGTSNQLKDNVDNLKSLTNLSSSGAAQISTTMEELASTASTLAENVQTVNQNAMEMGDNIDEIFKDVESLSDNTQQMNDAKEVATEAIDTVITNTNSTVELISKVKDQIDETNEAIKQINTAVELIVDITSQTNLLSLNASIEAARAGVAGKGFAVVAEEIKKLAEESAKGAESIKAVTQNIIKQSGESVAMVEQIKELVDTESESVNATKENFDVLNNCIQHNIASVKSIDSKTKALDELKGLIIGSITELSAISEENAASNQEVTASVTNISSNVENIDEVTQEVLNSSDTLSELMTYFK